MVSSSEVIAHCQKNPPSYEKWSNKLKKGAPKNWENKKEKPKQWTEEEKERVLDALSELPTILLDCEVEGIFRMEKFLTDESNLAAGKDRQIVLHNNAFEKNQNLTRILAHEFAHKLYRQFYDTQDKGKSYAKSADWLSMKNPKTGENFITTWRNDFVEEDGINGPDEDFSNNIEYYLFAPHLLKSKNPKIYD